MIEKLNKKMLFAAWACTNKGYFSYQSWYSVLKKMFKSLIVFDPQQQTYNLGKNGMNKAFLEVVEKEKPDYIFFWLMYPPEFYLETLGKIKLVSPNTKVLNFFGDDDILFEIYTKYLANFVDYPLASHMEHFWKYKENNIPNAFSTFGVNTDNFKPLKLKKKYDVTFIGTPIEDRAEMIKHLVDNGVKVNIFGGGWYKYPELAKYYGGKVSTEEMVKIINESKINLNFSKTIGGKTGFKAKVFELCACNSFLLSEYFTGYTNYLAENKEIITFKDKKDLLDKVKFYLENDKEREKIAEAAYKKVVKNYSIEEEFKNIFEAISKIEKKPKVSNNLDAKYNEVSLDVNELSNKELVLNKIKDADYISFTSKKSINSDYKSPFQIISLKGDKPISSCDYSVFSNKLGDYLSCYHYKTFNSNKQRFYDLLDITQLMVKKEFFLKNLDKFMNFSNYKEDLVNSENTSFIGFPLLKRIAVPNIKKEDLGTIFAPSFENELIALYSSKKLLSSSYAYKLLLSSIITKPYIINYLINKLKLKFKSKKFN